MRKAYALFPVEAPLSQDPLVQLGLAETDAHASAVTTDGSGVKQLGTIAQISFGAWPL